MRLFKNTKSYLSIFLYSVVKKITYLVLTGTQQMPNKHRLPQPFFDDEREKKFDRVTFYPPTKYGPKRTI